MVAIGNTLAGDDGVGVEVVHRLRRRWSGRPEVLFEILPGDLLAVSELLDRAERFLFVDALSGERPGAVEVRTAVPRAFSPSLHQTDIGAVMATLERLGVADPFPSWEVWGVVIEPPRELREGLSPEVEAGAGELAERLDRHLETFLGGRADPP